ncbi:pre-rRNA-processing protein ESF1-like [Olea europaea var. sylvestris]|uniref:pre-rRNA-processing protein ESF1-like n=1 Tax=Olea europaea var. sylvestris TaxID=158386 RepID=UPI000C1D76EB|nr:pre-rRNA-processing protein ESF1-like [Olea europaea var. sylvestris]
MIMLNNRMNFLLKRKLRFEVPRETNLIKKQSKKLKLVQLSSSYYLLMTQEDNKLKGYNLKPKKRKGKKGKEIPDEDKIPDVDYDDPRFSSLFTSPLFALDPTDPQFKRSAVYARQMARKNKGDHENAIGTLHTQILL